MVSRFTIGRIKREEKKAEKKIDKYKRKGIKIQRSQSPLSDSNYESKVDAAKYLKRLKLFNSSHTKFLKGKKGVAIPQDTFMEYKKLEAELKPKYNKWWQQYGGRRTIHGGKETDQTIETEAWVTDNSGRYPFGKTFKIKSISDFDSEEQIKKEIGEMMKQLDPDYEKMRAQKIKENMINVVDTFNEPWLKKLIESLDDDEILDLNYRTDFVESFYYVYDLIKKGLMSVNELDEYNNQLEHIFNTINSVSKKDLGNMYDYVEYNSSYEVDYNDYDF